jgi:hypothetical protein
MEIVLLCLIFEYSGIHLLFNVYKLYNGIIYDYLALSTTAKLHISGIRLIYACSMFLLLHRVDITVDWSLLSVSISNPVVRTSVFSI